MLYLSIFMTYMKNKSLHISKECGCAQIVNPATGSNQAPSAPVTGFITRTWDGNDCLHDLELS